MFQTTNQAIGLEQHLRRWAGNNDFQQKRPEGCWTCNLFLGCTSKKSWLKSSWAENCYYLNIYIYICCVVGGKKTTCNSGHHVAYMCLCLWFYDILCVFENVKSDDTHKMRIAIDGNSGWDQKFDDGNPTHPSPKSQLKIKTLQFIHVSMAFKTCKASDQDNNQSWLWLSSNEPRFFLNIPHW